MIKGLKIISTVSFASGESKKKSFVSCDEFAYQRGKDLIMMAPVFYRDESAFNESMEPQKVIGLGDGAFRATASAEEIEASPISDICFNAFKAFLESKDCEVEVVNY